MKGSSKAESGLLFISGSVYRRIPIFKFQKPCEIFLETLDAYRSKYAFLVHAYALMPDHYHLVLWFPPEQRLVNFLRDFKSLVGKRILEWTREKKMTDVLARFELGATRRRNKDARYCVLQYNCYVKQLLGSRAFWETIHYIHLNPVRDGLASLPEGYIYSSAQAYSSKSSGILKIDLPK